MKGLSFCVHFINGFIAAAVAANIPMIDATTAMVSNVIAAFLITVVSSHHVHTYIFDI
jgi:hypothetical protein